MRINDITLPDHSLNEQENENKMNLLSFFQSNNLKIIKNDKKSQTTILHEIEDKLRKLSYNFLDYKISISNIAKQIQTDKENLIKKLKNENVELIKSGFESFKMFEWNQSLYYYEKSYCISGIIDFIERKFIKKNKKKNVNTTKNMIELKNDLKIHNNENQDDNEKNIKSKLVPSILKFWLIFLLNLDSSNNILLNNVYYTCELIQLVKDIRNYYLEEKEEAENFEEKLKNEQKKDFVYRLTKKCLEILTESQWDETKLSRQSKEEKGIA